MKEESRIVEETRQKIAAGELTYEMMKEKLIAAINKEYEKEGEPDIKLINACEELLADLVTDGQPLPESHERRYGEVIRQNIQVSHPVRNSGRFAKRLAVLLVALVLLIGGGQVFLHREWFEHGTTDDEQQHTIQGFVVDPNLIARCIAEGKDSSALFFSDNYIEIKNYLGFDLPQSNNFDEWVPVQYFVEIQPIYVKCSTMYSNSETNERFTVQIGMYTDVSNAYTAFEQNGEGDEVVLSGIKIYHNNNLENNTAIWIVGNCIWRCYGHISDKQLLTIVEEIIGGITYE